MWLHFLIQVLFSLLVIYGLGFPLVNIIPQLSRIRWGCAPLASSFLLSAFANLYVLAGFRTNWLGLIAPIALLDVIALTLHGKSKAIDQSEYLDVALYVAVGVAVASFYYVKPLDGAASFAQGYDNYSHLSTVRSYLDSGFFADGSLVAYPELWRTLTAVVASFDNELVTVAANAVNFVILAAVMPLSVFSFLSVVTNDRLVVVAGSVISVAFQAFPWAFLFFGPLYPNLIGYALLPVVMSIFVLMTKAESPKSFLFHLLLFALGCLVLLISHPSAIFAGIVLIYPYGVREVYLRSRQQMGGKVVPLLFALAFTLLVCGFWTACYYSPVFAGAVMFNWPAFSSTPQAFASILSLALDRISTQQLALSVLVFVGVVTCILKRGNCWMIVSWCLGCLIYIVDVSKEGWLKHFLAGFWYTDSFRVAAVLALACIPLASIGLSEMLKLVLQLAEESDKRRAKLLALLTAAIIIFCPSLPLVRSSNPSENKVLKTAFGDTYSRLSWYYFLAVGDSTYDSDEISFASRAKEIVGDARVLNFPYDGSIFAYGVSGINVCNRTWGGYGTDGNMSLINEGVDRVAFDGAIQNAIAEENIRYLIMFDYGNDTGGGLDRTEYNPDFWTGIEGITDQTDGFTLLLSDGDMRLYRIDFVSD